MLEEDNNKKERVSKWVTELELEAGNSKDEKMEAICDNEVYASKLGSSQLLKLYYPVE